ncbi:esterase/lipase family protein [Rubinisphaera brasiliensis]|uniref:AB hydrolase-1 domain-containing protein n=1 Tax=Rubinisphaera brasiliensis (strain ATCC 49424 / DSM 5305 / JCM 21570 / IAM 15109 / NBRC 103401 / IFAM 1448) TaxID=756272 RepID=F0SJ14_RUBBR|nr:alpha/beta hydrolase [Rubinisphaera brasiliensis]ADY58556.1 hypothetical protein Plabr_0935 [Rubinisphaera brasiliensis DSM 5305]
MKSVNSNLRQTLVALFWAAVFVSTTGCSALQTHTCGHAPNLNDGPLIPDGLAASWGWTGFRKPSDDTPARLVQLKPYEPGKIPVVFIHGLASTPGTWQKMVEQLRLHPEIQARYQFWVFQYPTGNSYLQSAAELRKCLRKTIQEINPAGEDAALSQMVLVGHSMGGLIAKLQANHSDDVLWNAVSDQPFDKLKTDEATRRQIAETLYFEPLPFVKRVVFIATPHRGSLWTEHPVGRLGRKLIEFPATIQADYEQLVEANFNLLAAMPKKTVPTSLDHLAPDSSVLLATSHLRMPPNVYRHSILGTGRFLPDWTKGDGVVSEESARLENVHSEMLVSASHTRINQHHETIVEVRSILLLHLRYLDYSISPTLKD